MQTRDLGALMELVATNARAIQSERGSLGILNWLGDAALRLAHIARHAHVLMIPRPGYWLHASGHAAKPACRA